MGIGIAVDGSGNAYVTGATCSTNFVLVNPLQATTGGFRDAFITKINAAGSQLVYSTYLGGGSYESGKGIAVDGSGNAYVTGNTDSPNFPLANPLQATIGSSTIFVQNDAFVTKKDAVEPTRLLDLSRWQWLRLWLWNSSGRQ